MFQVDAIVLDEVIFEVLVVPKHSQAPHFVSRNDRVVHDLDDRLELVFIAVGRADVPDVLGGFFRLFIPLQLELYFFWIYL